MSKAIDALVLIDMQRDIIRDAGGESQAVADAHLAAVAARLQALLGRARAQDIPVLHVQHCEGPGEPLEKGSPGWEILPPVAPVGQEPVFMKEVCDAFHDTGLKEALDKLGAAQIAIGGYMTQYCIDTSCRSAVAKGFNVILCGDGHGTVDGSELSMEQIIRHHNDTLNGFYVDGRVVDVRPTAEVLA